MEAVEKALLVDVLSPTAVVEAGKWVGADGNKVAVAGVRAHGIALAEFSAKDVAAATAIPPKNLTVCRLGFAEVKLGGTIGDNAFGTCDANGDTIAAGAGQARLCFVPKGGDAGDRRRVLVLGNFESTEASAAIADLAGGADLATTVAKVNAILATLRARNVIAT